MAPPLTPERTSYVSVKTPTLRPSVYAPPPEKRPAPPRGRGIVAMVVIVACMVLYVFGQVAYFTPVYKTEISTTLKDWWGVVPVAQPKVGGGASPPPSASGNHSAPSGASNGSGNHTGLPAWHGNATVGGGNHTTGGNTTLVATAFAYSAPPTKGHNEMVLPTYFFLFGMLPLLVSGVLFEFLRRYNVRRLLSHSLLQVALVLRRKPALFGKVSYWSYGEWLFFLAVVGGNIYVFDRSYEPRIKSAKASAKHGLTTNVYLENIAQTLGFSCIFNMAFLFLPATRNAAWMEFFNISYANSIKYHRWLGVVTVLTAFLHCVGYYIVWVREGEWKEQALPCFDCDLGKRPGNQVWMNVFGELALLLFLIMGLTSIPFVRRQFYNLFYYTHQLLFVAVIAAVLHWGKINYWVFPTFVVYCFGRALSMSSNFAPVHVEELTTINDVIVRVVLKRSPGRDTQYKVGQFLYLNVPAISKLQWHAFTVAATTPTTVTVLVKSLGDWTNDLVEHANECKAKNVLPTVYVDGFYGASLELYDEYSTILLVGGGIGVTPIFAILNDLVAKLGNRETLTQKVVFVFSFRSIALLEEVHPLLTRLKELDPQEQFFKTHFYLTQVPTDGGLSHPVDNERLQGKSAQPTTYESTSSTPIAFAEPLRSRGYRSLVFTVVVAIGVLIILALDFGGGKVERTHANFWPLQHFVDSLVAIGVACVVFSFVLAERLSKRNAANAAGASKDVEMNVFQSVGTSALPLAVADMHTYRDLLSHYHVVQGERPDVATLLTQTLAFHTAASVVKPEVGVFVSGPETLKRSVEYAVHGLGAQHFDVHEEQFEL